MGESKRETVQPPLCPSYCLVCEVPVTFIRHGKCRILFHVRMKKFTVCFTAFSLSASVPFKNQLRFIDSSSRIIHGIINYRFLLTIRQFSCYHHLVNGGIQLGATSVISHVTDEDKSGSGLFLLLSARPILPHNFTYLILNDVFQGFDHHQIPLFMHCYLFIRLILVANMIISLAC